jgi:hypothetical protein
MLREQQVKLRKRAKQINNFGELNMSFTPNTFNSLNESLLHKYDYLLNLILNAEHKI